MSYREPDLFGEFQILQGIHRWNTNFNTEMTALVSALGSDSLTTHDSTIETRSAALTFGLNQTRAQNDALLLINAAKGGKAFQTSRSFPRSTMRLALRTSRR